METFKGLGFTAEKVEFLPSLYHPSARDLISALQSATAPSVLLISHNPGITEFAELLARNLPSNHQFYDFPTGATWVGAFNIDVWKNLCFKTESTLDFAIPREMAS